MRKAIAILLAIYLHGKILPHAFAGDQEGLELLKDWGERVDRAVSEQKCDQALFLLEEAARSGEWVARFELGRFHELGICLEVNHQTAIEHYQQAAAMGGCVVNMRIAYLQVHRLGVPSDSDEVNRRYTNAALCQVAIILDPQQTISRLFVTWIMNPYPIPDEFEREVDWVRQIGKADAETQYGLAMQLMEGVGLLPKNVEAARYILGEAALKDLPKAQFAYGKALITGELGKRDKWSGLRFLYSAANAGLPGAQADLGLRHIRGDLVVKSRIHAYLWLREAMKNGADVADTLAAVESAMTQDEFAYARAIKTPQYRPDRDQLK